ncbi:MAG TPA: hypothetical protein VMF55_15910 [Solirubrobacterales bacterium]|nr:hypothetical protein [Solirubrobacterales bacterium]
MRKRAILVGLALSLVFVASAAAIRFDERIELRAGNLVLAGRGGFAPETLPKDHNAPIILHGAGSISTVNGELPPILEKVIAEFDRHGALDTTGLGVCTVKKLQATTVAEARHVCADAIVGEGVGHGVVAFPEQKPIPVSSPLTLFNGPKEHGLYTVIGHGYLNIPVPTTYIVPVVIERIHNGVYGYRIDVKIPPIAGGYGIPISAKGKVGRKWTFEGRRHSFLNARCEVGYLQAKGQFFFKDGTYLTGTIAKPCKVSGR